MAGGGRKQTIPKRVILILKNTEDTITKENLVSFTHLYYLTTYQDYIDTFICSPYFMK